MGLFSPSVNKKPVFDITQSKKKEQVVNPSAMAAATSIGKRYSLTVNPKNAPSFRSPANSRNNSLLDQPQSSILSPRSPSSLQNKSNPGLKTKGSIVRRASVIGSIDKENKRDSTIFYDAQEAFDDFGGPQAKGNLIKNINPPAKNRVTGDKTKHMSLVSKKVYKYVPSSSGLVMVEVDVNDENDRLQRSSSIATSIRRSSSNISLSIAARTSSMNSKTKDTHTDSMNNTQITKTINGKKISGNPSKLKRSSSMNSMRNPKPLANHTGVDSLSENHGTHVRTPLKKKAVAHQPDFILEETTQEVEIAKNEEKQQRKSLANNTEKKTSAIRKKKTAMKVNPMTVNTHTASPIAPKSNLKQKQVSSSNAISNKSALKSSTSEYKDKRPQIIENKELSIISDNDNKLVIEKSEVIVTNGEQEGVNDETEKENISAAALPQPPIIQLDEYNHVLDSPSKIANTKNDSDHGSLASVMRSNNSYLNNKTTAKDEIPGEHNIKAEIITNDIHRTPVKKKADKILQDDTVFTKPLMKPALRNTPSKNPSSSNTTPLNTSKTLSKQTSSASLSKTPKSAMKKTSRLSMATEEAYLKLTTAENTRLNAQLLDENQPKSKIIRSPSKRLSTMRTQPIITGTSMKKKSDQNVPIRNKPTKNDASVGKNNRAGGKDQIDRNSILYPSEPERKSSFERERSVGSNMGFKMMSMRNNVGGGEPGAYENEPDYLGGVPTLARGNGTLKKHVHDDNDEFHNFKKGFKSRFADSDSDTGSEYSEYVPKSTRRSSIISRVTSHKQHQQQPMIQRGPSPSSGQSLKTSSKMLNGFHSQTKPTPTLRDPPPSDDRSGTGNKNKTTFGGKLKKIFGRSKK